MTLLSRRTAITMSVALVAVGGLSGCGGNKPATTPSPTPSESSMMSATPSDDSMMSPTPSDDSMMGTTSSEDSMMGATPSEDSMMEDDADDQ